MVNAVVLLQGIVVPEIETVILISSVVVVTLMVLMTMIAKEQQRIIRMEKRRRWKTVHKVVMPVHQKMNRILIR